MVYKINQKSQKNELTLSDRNSTLTLGLILETAKLNN